MISFYVIFVCIWRANPEKRKFLLEILPGIYLNAAPSKY